MHDIHQAASTRRDAPTAKTDIRSLDRRDALKMLLAISAAGAAACSSKGDTPASKANTGPAPKALTEANVVLLTALVDTIIPRTDTPGALDAGVPKTLADLVSDWGDDNYRRHWVSGMTALDKTLAKMAGQPFAKMSAKQREAALSKYDADVYSGKIDDGFYKDMKATAATAYYMSEPGATEELIYEPVPGEWKGCIPFADVGRTWAT